MTDGRMHIPMQSIPLVYHGMVLVHDSQSWRHSLARVRVHVPHALAPVPCREPSEAQRVLLDVHRNNAKT